MILSCFCFKICLLIFLKFLLNVPAERKSGCKSNPAKCLKSLEHSRSRIYGIKGTQNSFVFQTYFSREQGNERGCVMCTKILLHSFYAIVIFCKGKLQLKIKKENPNCFKLHFYCESVFQTFCSSDLIYLVPLLRQKHEIKPNIQARI